MTTGSATTITNQSQLRDRCLRRRVTSPSRPSKIAICLPPRDGAATTAEVAGATTARLASPEGGRDTRAPGARSVPGADIPAFPAPCDVSAECCAKIVVERQLAIREN